MSRENFVRADELPSGWMDELKSKVDLVRLISVSVQLSKRGDKWWGCCPFHHEKTASFCVSERTGFFYCFGCHESGDAISWVQKTEGLEFYDAVKYLAKTVGMTVPQTQRDSRELQKKERLYAMMRQAALHYYKNFCSNAEAKQYMLGRGLREETLRRFGIGYSVGGQALETELAAMGFSVQEMSDCALIGIDAEHGTHYDAMSRRIVIPIFDAQGRVIAFGGRILHKEDSPAKYKNSRESALFVKNRTLYGLNFVKTYRLRHAMDSIIMVEGYMDVIALVEAGFENVVASMGTALTEQQAALLKRYVDKVYICYDGDKAGQMNTMRGLGILKNAGLDVLVVNLPDGLDPDELIRQRGNEAYQRCLDAAVPLYQHRLNKAMEKYDLTTADGRSRYAKECLQIVSDLDAVEQDAYLDVIAQRAQIDKKVLRSSLVRAPKRPATTVTVSPTTQAEPAPHIVPADKLAYYKACRFVLGLMLTKPDYTEDWLSPEYYLDPIHRSICTYVWDCMRQKELIVPSNIYRLQLDKEECAQVLLCELFGGEELDLAYNHNVACIKLEYLEEKKKQLLQSVATVADADEKRQLLVQLQQLAKEIALLKTTGGK